MSEAPWWNRCIRCRALVARKWKCCPRHTTERGPDIVCHRCALALHRPTVSSGTRDAKKEQQ